MQAAENQNKEATQSQKVMAVRVSTITENKAIQLHKFMKYSSANRTWGKDENLLRCNLLLVPTSRNYTVLLALGRSVAYRRTT